MIVFLSLVILTITLIIVVSRRRPNYPPGPFPWPFIGNRCYVRKLAQKFGGQQFAFTELSKQYNSSIISVRLGINDLIVVSDHKLIHEVLTREEYEGRPWNEFIKIRNMGMRKGITMNDGPECKKLRSWSVRTLKYAGFAAHEMNEMIIHELTLVLEKLKDGGVHFLRPFFAPVSINVLWKIVTGKEPAEDASKLNTFMNLLDRRAQIFDAAGGVLSAFPWIRYIAPEASGYNLLLALNNDLKNIITDSIDEHKRRYVKGNEIDFIDMFLRGMSTQEDNDVFSDENLIVTLVDFFIAGTTTTTSSLDFAFWYLVTEQEVQRKLHEEIDTIIGRNRLPNLNDRVRMPFTKAVLTECQRIRTVAPILGPRRVLCNTILGDYVIPKNTTVLINTFSTNMNPIYFPEPTVFRPERHLDECGAYQANENVIIFGKGKRRCPGEALAKTTIFLIFVGIMQKYRLLSVPDKSIETEVIDGFVISPKPYEVLIVPR